LNQMNGKIDNLTSLCLEQSVIIKQLIAAQPSTEAQWMAKLKLPWRKEEDVLYVFADPELEALFKCYVRQFIGSGKIVDFHKTYFTKIMTKNMFCMSFLKKSGHNIEISYGHALFVLPEGVANVFWEEVGRRPELKTLANHFADKLKRFVNNEKNEWRMEQRRKLLNWYRTDWHANTPRKRLAIILLTNDVLKLKAITEPIDFSTGDTIRQAVHKWRPLVNQAFKETFPTKALRDEAAARALKPPRHRGTGSTVVGSDDQDSDRETQTTE
jgi:hypothetical protein